MVLLEQGKLTSGSTWHAAGLVGQLRSSASITQVLKYSVELYKRLEAETGLATGWKMTGCLRLATNEDRWTEFRRLATTARSFGMEMELISPAEVKKMWPLLEVSDLIGASWLPTDGQASPSDITQSLAKGARQAGAKIFEGVTVTGFDMDGDRITAVRTTGGTITCDTVVNCAGQWARQVGAMAGINVPLQPVKHQYIITDKLDGLASNVATIRDPDRRTYFKEEVGGLVMGGYEPDPIPWTTGDVPGDFQFRLFDDDWDHFEQHLEQAIARVPALAETGVRRMINGPESFTPDGNFILGPAPECRNMYVGAGFNAFGIASGGGAGWALAQWAITGEAPMDLWVVDIRRFSAMHRNHDWVNERTLEAYAGRSTPLPIRMRNTPAVGVSSSPPQPCRPAEGGVGRRSAQSSAGSGRIGSRPKAPSMPTSIRWVGRTGSMPLATSTGRCARAWASSTNRRSRNTKSRVPAPPGRSR